MMHPGVFDYYASTDQQELEMSRVREAAHEYAETLDQVLPAGPDKTYLLRKLREVAMWANIAITRFSDGTPRT